MNPTQQNPQQKGQPDVRAARPEEQNKMNPSQANKQFGGRPQDEEEDEDNKARSPNGDREQKEYNKGGQNR